MPYILPLDSTASIRRPIYVENNLFIFEISYYPNIKCWLMDIYKPADSDNTEDIPILTGINLRTGIDNLIKGKASQLDGWAINVASIDGTDNDGSETLGNTCFVVMYAPGEVVPQSFKDKRLD